MKTPYFTLHIHRLSSLLILLSAFAAICSFGSCQKLSQEDTKIRGQVVNQTDNSPLVGYQVHLVETETPPKPFAPLIIKTLDTKVTDANGRFDFGEWDLNKRSRFDYTVQFDPNGEEFASQDWDRGSYKRVNMKEKVELGEDNNLLLQMVKFGNVKFRVENHSTIDPLEINLILRNNFTENPSGSFRIPSGGIEVDQTPPIFSPGPAEVLCLFSDSNGSFIDSIIQEIVVPHNETLGVHISYP